MDLTVRNLAMSTAMALHHQRTGDPSSRQSERVTQRCNDSHAEPEDVKKRLEVRWLPPKAKTTSSWPGGTTKKAAIAAAVLALPSELETQSRLWIAMMKRRMKMNRLM